MRSFTRLYRNATVGLVVALLSFVSDARADAAEEAQQAFQRGVAATHAGRWLDAHSEFQRSLELSPKLTARFNLAVTDLKLGLGEEALREVAAFEAQATPEQHGDLLQRVPRLRQRADALVASRPPPLTSSNGPLEPLEVSLGVVVSGVWWSQRSDAKDECARSEACDNDAQLERQQRAAIATTVTLGVASIGLVVGGAVWLAQSKRQRRQGAAGLAHGRGLLLRF